MSNFSNKLASIIRPLWAPLIDSQPHLLQLWRPFLAFSAIEIGFKLIGYWIAPSSMGMGVTEFIAYILRIVFEVSLLAHLALILQNQPPASSIWYFPFEKTMKVLFTRLLIFAAIILPLSFIAAVFDVQKGSQGFGYIMSYLIILVWMYAIGYFYFALWFNTWVIVSEDQGPIQSFITSYNLTSGHWLETTWVILKVAVRFFLLATIVSAIIALIIGSAASGIGHLIAGVSPTEKLLVSSAQDITGYLFLKIMLGFPMQGFVAVAVVRQYFRLQQLQQEQPDSDDEDEEEN